MGAIAERLAHRAWVTSDNPRTEDPKAILQDIVAGMHPNRYTLIADRKEAIKAACAALQPGDWLVVAGKGHENYQIIGNKKQPFSDHRVVEEAMSEC